MAQRRLKHPHRAKRKKPLILKAQFWYTIILAAAFGGGVTFACFSPWFQIKDIKVSGTNAEKQGDFTDTLQASAQKQLAFMTSKSILLFDLQGAKQELLKRFPEVADIQIKRQFPSTIYAAVSERLPAAALSALGGGWYIVDDTGTFFRRSDVGEGVFKISGDFGQKTVDFGQTIIAKDLLQNILRARVGIENNAGIPLSGAAIKNSERIDFTAAEGWQIFVNPEGDLDWQVSKLQAVAADPAFAAQRKNLDYVDLRFTRVYVKQK